MHTFELVEGLVVDGLELLFGLLFVLLYFLLQFLVLFFELRNFLYLLFEGVELLLVEGVDLGDFVV